MSLQQPLVAEMEYEAINTRKMLLRVPEDKFSWKPHEKSMTIGRLASHIAEIPVWVNRTLEAGSFNFASLPAVRNTYGGTEALLAVYNERMAAAVHQLQLATDEMLGEPFSLLRGEHTIATMPRKVLIRSFAMNHLIHHRGQLSVYLRLLEVPVPGMYGPSADEQ
ncbi:MAG TPA: DinB family protein [Chitinophagaceae bacterium]|nr:DinB family protein [Chitinophagaceae bacterium]